MRKVIYTCITGNYDELQKPEVVTPGWDYIVFTDDPKLNAPGWRKIIIKTNKPIYKGLEAPKIQRRVKILAHEYLPDYDLSIWIDGNILIKTNLDDFVAKNLHKGNILALMTHDQRKCIYEEGRVCAKLRKDNHHLINKQMEWLKKQKMPKDQGMVQTGLQIRLHNDPKLVDFNNRWFEIVKEFSKRDQLSFNFVMWKHGFKNWNQFTYKVIFGHGFQKRHHLRFLMKKRRARAAREAKRNKSKK